MFFSGVIITLDMVDWFRGRFNVFDPVGLLGVFGFHFFFMAPLLHVVWDWWMTDRTIRIADLRPLAGMDGNSKSNWTSNLSVHARSIRRQPSGKAAPNMATQRVAVLAGLNYHARGFSSPASLSLYQLGRYLGLYSGRRDSACGARARQGRRLCGFGKLPAAVDDWLLRAGPSKPLFGILGNVGRDDVYVLGADHAVRRSSRGPIEHRLGDLLGSWNDSFFRAAGSEENHLRGRRLFVWLHVRVRFL